MKRIISVLLVWVLLASQMYVFAEASYTSFIDAVKADESVDMSLIDENRIIYAEITSYINLDKDIKPTSFYLYMPSLNGKDYYTAGFDKNEYVATTKNFVATEPLKYYSVDEAKEFAMNNGLSEPTEIKAILTHGRIGLFAYSIVCDGKDYIIPYYFTTDSTYNITNDNTVRLSLGTAYTIDEFVTISEKEHTLYDEYMNAERENNNKPTVSLDESGDKVINGNKQTSSNISNNQEVTKSDKAKDEEKLSGGDPSNILTFEELTKLSKNDIDHIVIRSGIDGIGYSTSYDKIISEIYTAINTKSFNVYMKEGNSGGWLYQILFFDKDNSEHSYTISNGMVVKGITYRTSNEEELKNVTEKAYNLISNNCSSWANDYIALAKDSGFLDGVTDISYKEPITRENFCEIIYNMLIKTSNDGITVPSAFYFTDTYNNKVSALYYADIIKGKSERIFAPNDYLTREEAATILYRVAQFIKIDMPQSIYDETTEYYDDKDIISEWAFTPVYYMKEMEIMVGTSENIFSPQDTYTSEQAISTIVRLYNKHHSK